MVTHIFNTSTLAVAVGTLNLRPAWSMLGVLGQAGLHSVTLFQKRGEKKALALETCTRSHQPICSPQVTKESSERPSTNQNLNRELSPV